MRKFLNKYWGWTFLIVPIILQAVFFYFPMVQGAFYSLTNWTGLTYNYKFVLPSYHLYHRLNFGFDYWRNLYRNGCGTCAQFEN